MSDLTDSVYMRVLRVFVLLLVASCAGGVVKQSDRGQMATSMDDGVVRGVVRNAQGWELEGLSVVALSQEGHGTRLGLTDVKGLYWIKDLLSGIYVIQVLRGSQVVAERRLRVNDRAVDTHFIVPVQYLDRPDQRTGPIVDRYFISSSLRK